MATTAIVRESLNVSEGRLLERILRHSNNKSVCFEESFGDGDGDGDEFGDVHANVTEYVYGHENSSAVGGGDEDGHLHCFELRRDHHLASKEPA